MGGRPFSTPFVIGGSSIGGTFADVAALFWPAPLILAGVALVTPWIAGCASGTESQPARAARASATRSSEPTVSGTAGLIVGFRQCGLLPKLDRTPPKGC